MREIKFRGFSKILNTWIYGDLIQSGSKFYIAKQGFLAPYECFGTSINILGFEEFEDIFEVEPESIGQYTRLKDKNSKEIYENDIVTFILPEKFGIKQKTHVGVIKYDSSITSHKIYTYKNLKSFLHNYVYDCFYIADDTYIEVIGNIFENPDLLEG